MISHPHQTIFVHIPKCAGSSIEQMFLDELGLRWDQRAALLLRRRVDDEPGPLSLTHLTASGYVEHHHISQRLFDTYFKFAVVRNPLDRVRSTYTYLGAAHVMSFDRFVADHIVPGATDAAHSLHWFFRPQVDFLLRDGALAVNQIIRLEKLNSDFPAVAAQAGLSKTRVPHENSSVSKPTGSTLRSAARAIVRFKMRPGLDRNNASMAAETLTAIQDVYSADFSYLDYPRQPLT